MDHIDPKQLRAWEKQIAAEVAALRDRRMHLESELKLNESKLELIRQMISLDQPSGSEVAAPQLPEPAKATSITVKESVKNILERAGRPLHISEIHREFITRGYPIPGSGTPFNILVHIVKDRGFVRVARGTYTLRTGAEVDLGMPGKDGRKSRRKRRKRKAKLQIDPQS
ncbi:MAG: winged helix-turn-helix domain-containing protein [Terriglobia bacterium]